MSVRDSDVVPTAIRARADAARLVWDEAASEQAPASSGLTLLLRYRPTD